MPVVLVTGRYQSRAYSCNIPQVRNIARTELVRERHRSGSEMSSFRFSSVIFRRYTEGSVVSSNSDSQEAGS